MYIDTAPQKQRKDLNSSSSADRLSKNQTRAFAIVSMISEVVENLQQLTPFKDGNLSCHYNNFFTVYVKKLLTSEESIIYIIDIHRRIANKQYYISMFNATYIFIFSFEMQLICIEPEFISDLILKGTLQIYSSLED